MSLLQFFLTGRDSSRQRKSDVANALDDPLMHPDVQAMSLVELADLPLMPENLGRPVPHHPEPLPLAKCA